MKNSKALGLLLLAACGDSKELVLRTSLADGGTVVVGTPCVPLMEQSTTFDGYRLSEVSVESAAGNPPGGAVCIGFDFQGLTTCPYGQDADGGSPSGQPCTTPDGMPVVGAVAPQCTNHRPSQSVVWSCLCANVDGQTNDGQTYCDCPTGTSCVQTLTALNGSTALTGAYCLPSAEAKADRGCASECQPGTEPCD